MDQSQLMRILEDKYEEMKKEFGLKITLDELDSVFYVRDFILQQRYVSETALNRMLSHRIVDIIRSWVMYIHALVMPQPGYMIGMEESNMFDDAEKDDLIKLMTKIMAYVGENNLISLTKDKKAESLFFDNSLKFWNKIKPELVEVMAKIDNEWKKKIKT